MLSNSDWTKITRYLSGECSLEERERIEAWIEADPERRARVEELRRIWEEVDAEPRARDVDTAWQKVQRRIQEGQDDRDPSEERKPARPRTRRRPRRRSTLSTGQKRMALGIATVCLLAVAAVFLLYDPTGGPTAPSEPQVFSTSPGERTEATLPDGSSVVLNVDSRLTVSPSFGEESRTVRLDGEAYFEVEAGRPFVVETVNARVRVLGTSFGVRSYTPDEDVSVVVAEGEVGVAPEGSTTPEQTLRRQQRAVVSPEGDVSVTSNVALDRYLDWREGKMVFESTPLPSVIEELERQYGLRIALLDSELADRRLTTTFQDETLDEVLDVVALSLNVGYRRTDSTVVFGRPGREGFQGPSSAAPQQN